MVGRAKDDVSRSKYVELVETGRELWSETERDWKPREVEGRADSLRRMVE